MILSQRASEFSVPHTSTCLIKTAGRINNGDTVSVISPVFPSHRILQFALESSDSFEVTIKILTPEGYIDSDGTIKATLVCDDNDVQHMYVRIQ